VAHILKEQSSVSAPIPAAGEMTLFVDSADDHFKRKNSSGIVTDIEQAAAGVASFEGRNGIVTSAAGDYTASEVTNVPYGFISSTNVQAAINELVDEVAENTDITDAAIMGKLLTGLTESYGVVTAGNTIIQALSKLVWSQNFHKQTIAQDFTVPTDYTLIRGATYISGSSKLIIEGTGLVKFI
jgi:hypothetical protein